MATNDQAAAVTKCEADIARLVRKMANDVRRLEGLRRQLAGLTAVCQQQGTQAAPDVL